MSLDYRTIAHQVTGQVQAIEQASGTAQRLLALELAHSLSQWEAAQSEALTDQDHLLRAAHLANLAQLVANEAAAITAHLSEKKAALRKGLQDNAEQLRVKQGELAALRDEVDSMSKELSVTASCLAELAAREAEWREQRDACEQLRDYQARCATVQAELADLRTALQDGCNLLSALLTC